MLCLRCALFSTIDCMPDVLRWLHGTAAQADFKDQMVLDTKGRAVLFYRTVDPSYYVFLTEGAGLPVFNPVPAPETAGSGARPCDPMAHRASAVRWAWGSDSDAPTLTVWVPRMM